MSIKIASMNFGDCDTIMHNTPNGMKNIAEVLGPNGEVYWSAIKEITSIPPLSIRSNGTMLLDYLISGNMSQSGTPTPDNPIQPQETGDLETVGVKAGQYKIPISSANTTTPIYLGEVETTRRIGKLVLDGTETFYASGSWGKTNTAVYYTTLSNVKNLSTNVAYVMCSHYVGASRNYIHDNDIECSGITGSNSLTFRVSRQYAGTKEDFLAYLASEYAAGTPVTVWYVLATPETAVVNEPLRKIGDYADTVSYEQAGVQIPTNRGNTVIDVETALKPSQMYIKYK